MDAWIKVEDAQVLGALKRLVALGRDATPAMRDIATLGESTTRLRFRNETGPDGVKWKPSLRARITGGRTLTKDSHLVDSTSSNFGPESAEWGVNRVYAAIHQFGGKIEARNGGKLRFRLANGGFATVDSITMPARPFLGISPDDADDILDILQTRINACADGGVDAR